jgi:serine-type D-Ala-D-Ala carboxypeptidase/endopeptidase (penicillin-binding protein 4)
VALAAAALALALPSGASGAPAEIQTAVSAFAASHPRSTILVARLDGTGAATPVAAHRADTPLIPASTMKLASGAGALIELGPAHRFATRLLAGPATRRDGRTLRGPVYLRGAGDPVLATRAYAAAWLPAGSTRLADLAAPLRRRGVRLVRGPIVADESLFDARRLGPGWPSRYAAYAAPLSALATNQDHAGNGRARYAADPPLAAARRLRAALRGVGVAQRGPLRAGRTPPGARVLATAASPPLATVVRTMNLDIDNFIAEMLTKGIGAAAGAGGSTAAGTARTTEVLSERGLLGPGDRLVDGSGLSRANRLSARSLVRILAAADADPGWGAALIASMARGGEGTLVRRFATGVATRRVRAKTGYLDGVSAMAGRVVSRRGPRYAFAVVANTPDIAAARAIQERVVVMLASGVADQGAVVAAAPGL